MLLNCRTFFIVSVIVSFSALPLITFGRTNNKIESLKYGKSTFLKKIQEPSDIVFDNETNHFFIVSDHGILFETDLNGTVLRKANIEGMDFEGVEVKDSFVYVSDEKPRKVYQYLKKDLSLKKVYSVPWGGERNKGFESISYNYAKDCFILVSEKPVFIIEYSNDFRKIKSYPFPATDISAARWKNGELLLLGKTQRCIFTCDPKTYEVKQETNINVVNPEGLAFDDSDNLFVVSDDLQRLYLFNNYKTKAN